jgi:hypothetical protein
MHTSNDKIVRTAVSAALLCATLISGAQAQTIPGYYSPLTNTFHPRLKLQPATGGVIRAGTIAATIGIALVSPVISGQQIQCTVTFTANDAAGGFGVVTSAVSAVVNGKAATCTTTLPYEFTLQATSFYSVDVSVLASSTSGLLLRNVILPSTASATLPANGTTTRLSFQTVL